MIYIAYDSSKVWGVGSEVLYQGSIYKCRVLHGPSPAYTPANGTYWEKIRTGLQAVVQSFEPGAMVDMFILDTSMLIDSEGTPGSVFYFVPGLNGDKTLIHFQGREYIPFPFAITGFEYSGVGKAPHPKIQVSNVTGLLYGLNLQYSDLVGAKVTRKRTFAQYLDGAENADPYAEFPLELYYIERKVQENRFYVEYELSGAYDFEGFMLPNSQVMSDYCGWSYRGVECGYTGGAVADIADNPTSVLALDQCGKRLTSCYLRYPGITSVLPYGGFPSVGKIQV